MADASESWWFPLGLREWDARSATDFLRDRMHTATHDAAQDLVANLDHSVFNITTNYMLGLMHEFMGAAERALEDLAERNNAIR